MVDENEIISFYTGRKIRNKKGNAGVDIQSNELSGVAQVFKDIGNGTIMEHVIGVFGKTSSKYIKEALKEIKYNADISKYFVFTENIVSDNIDIYVICAVALANFIREHLSSEECGEDGFYSTYLELKRIMRIATLGEDVFALCRSQSSLFKQRIYIGNLCKIALKKIKKIERYQNVKIVLQLEIPESELTPKLFSSFKFLEEENLIILFTSVSSVQILSKEQQFQILYLSAE